MGHQINQNGKTKSINQEKWIIFEKRLLSILSCFDKSSPFLRPLKWPYVVTWNPPETNPPSSQTKIFRAINNTGQAFSILIEGKTENMCYSKKRWTKNIFHKYYVTHDSIRFRVVQSFSVFCYSFLPDLDLPLKSSLLF